MAPVFESRFLIMNKKGLHARRAAIVVQTANGLGGDAADLSLYFRNEDSRADATSILGLLTLAATEGTSVYIGAESDSPRHVDNLVDYVTTLGAIVENTTDD